jgi:hypothetical protein
MKVLKHTLTLDNSWDRCHRMWRHIYDRVRTADYPVVRISSLKAWYLKDTLDSLSSIMHDCWFCEYAFKRNMQEYGPGSILLMPNPARDMMHNETCKYCPGKIIDPDFNCQTLDCCWADHPVKFYNKIRRMYEEWKRRYR